jgi:hypothetical protein
MFPKRPSVAHVNASFRVWIRRRIYETVYLVPISRLRCRSGRPCTRSPRGGRLVRVAAQGKTQGCANLFHSPWREVSHTLTQALLRHSDSIVKIHRAGALNTIFFVQPHFRGNPSDAGRDRRNRRRGQVSKGAIAGQHYGPSSFVRSSKTVEPNVAPGYSSGQIASVSQPDRFPESLGPAS